MKTFFQIGDNTTVLKGGFLSSGLTDLKLWVDGSRLSTCEASKRQNQICLFLSRHRASLLQIYGDT